MDEWQRDYVPGRDHLVTSLTVTDSANDSATLTAGYWYQLLATVDSHWRMATTAVTTDEFLPAYEWSPRFQARTDSDIVSVIRDGSVSGTAHVRCRTRGAR